MSVARHFVMRAAEGKDVQLEAALRALASTLLTLPGCGGVQMLRDSADAARFIFIEHWASVQAHQHASTLLAPEDLAPLMQALAGMPEGNDSYFEHHVLG